MKRLYPTLIHPWLLMLIIRRLTLKCTITRKTFISIIFRKVPRSIHRGAVSHASVLQKLFRTSLSQHGSPLSIAWCRREERFDRELAIRYPSHRCRAQAWTSWCPHLKSSPLALCMWQQSQLTLRLSMCKKLEVYCIHKTLSLHNCGFADIRMMTQPFHSVALTRPRSYVLFLIHSWYYIHSSNIHVQWNPA